MKKVLISLLLLMNSLFASVAVETKGMEAGALGDGTYLTASPTFVYDRSFSQGGIHSASDVWSPEKLRSRILLNRFSDVIDWDIPEASIQLGAGNEIGDMMLYDLLETGDQRETNRTPMMNAEFRTPSFHGFWAIGKLLQVDHFTSSTEKYRFNWNDSRQYSWFGENQPFFSTAYAGLGYTEGVLNLSATVGKEYVWLLGESGRWIPALYSPRVEGRLNYHSLQTTLVYENIKYENKEENEKGSRHEFNGSFYYDFGKGCCNTNKFSAGGGVQFRFVDDKNDTYFGLENEYVIWPFLELQYSPTRYFRIAGNAGGNENDWLFKDSVEWKVPTFYETEWLFGVRNQMGTRLNPLGESYEFFGSDTINLTTDGYMQLHQLYMDLNQDLSLFSFGGRVAGWVEKGAETFDTTGFDEYSSTLYFRYGNVERIDSWIQGVTGEVNLGMHYKHLLSVKARAGVERIRGDEERFEVNPSEEWVSIEANWTINKTFLVSHSWNYRSDAQWNLRSPDPLVVKGAWYWNATFEQLFPKYGLSLRGTLLHVLTDNPIEVPNGGYDRTRFFCNIKKTF